MHYAFSFWFVCEFREFPKKRKFLNHILFTHLSLFLWVSPNSSLLIQSVMKWRKFHDLMIRRYSKDRTCILRYENLVLDVIHEILPCLEFLGFGLDPKQVECILEKQEGEYHRPNNMSQPELNEIVRQTFTEKEFKDFRKTYEQIILRWTT